MQDMQHPSKRSTCSMCSMCSMFSRCSNMSIRICFIMNSIIMGIVAPGLMRLNMHTTLDVLRRLQHHW